MNAKILGAAIAVLTLAACGQQANNDGPSDSNAAANPPVSGLDIAGMDKTIKPGDDFFLYMNGSWIDATDIPADRPAYSQGAILRDQAQENVKAIIEMSATGDFAKGTEEQKVGDLYRSYTDMDARNAKGVAPLAGELEKIAAISDYDELAVYFADANRRGFDMPFSLQQYADFKDPTTYMMYTWQGGLGLPDRDYYFNEDEKSVSIRAAYVEHISAMLELAGLPADGATIDQIIALETRMAEAHMPKEETRNMVALYNKIALEELGELMPSFNWAGYIETSGIGDIDGLVVTMTDHMRKLDGIITDTSLDDWKGYLEWRVINASAARLNDALDTENFNFYGKTLSGTEEQRPRWRRAVNTVNGTLGEAVGKVYVKEHFPPEAKERMLVLVQNLVNAYEKSIKELDWMTEDTKAEALDKLSKFTPKIGYPDEWRDYSAVEIRHDDLYGNLQRAAIAEYDRALNRQGGKVDRGEWAMTPQTVNAYYNPPLNEIVFPAAILQPPFFNLAADEAVNYGAIGAVIGHEIGHGFDDSGSTFDGDGVLRNWWTDEDRAEFEARTAKLVDQYNAYRPFEDLGVNGEFTLGENIGDLGGISIGLLAYRMSLGDEEAPVIDGFTGEQRVFLGYAQVWRSKYRDDAMRQQIMTDPHSPSMYRANGAVRNVPEFYEAFDVSKEDAMYLSPEERVKIW